MSSSEAVKTKLTQPAELPTGEQKQDSTVARTLSKAVEPKLIQSTGLPTEKQGDAKEKKVERKTAVKVTVRSFLNYLIIPSIF